MKDRKIWILFISLILVSSCGAVKEGFSNQKKNNTDEFLVEKKAPLVMPPNYNELPTPKMENSSIQENDNNVKDLISTKEEKEINTNDNSGNSIEQIILDKIKK